MRSSSDEVTHDEIEHRISQLRDGNWARVDGQHGCEDRHALMANDSAAKYLYDQNRTDFSLKINP